MASLKHSYVNKPMSSWYGAGLSYVFTQVIIRIKLVHVRHNVGKGVWSWLCSSVASPINWSKEQSKSRMYPKVVQIKSTFKKKSYCIYIFFFKVVKHKDNYINLVLPELY